MVTAYDLANLVASVTGEDTGNTGDELSLIDRLIQEELDESIGIASQSGSLPVQGGSTAGPVGGEHYEDPASWFSDDNDLISEGKEAHSGGQRPQSGSWRESGLPPTDSAAQSKPHSGADSLSDPTLEIPADAVEEIASLRPGLELRAAGIRRRSAARHGRGRKGSAGKYVLYALLAAAASAIALVRNQSAFSVASAPRCGCGRSLGGAAQLRRRVAACRRSGLRDSCPRLFRPRRVARNPRPPAVVNARAE